MASSSVLRQIGQLAQGRLLCLLVAAARAQGVTRLYGDMLRGNMPMLALAQAEGFTMHRHPDDARLARVELATMAPNTPELVAVCA
ncbi:MAG: hypothetical protein ABI040_00880 [Rhodoferax sp.]